MPLTTFVLLAYCNAMFDTWNLTLERLKSSVLTLGKSSVLAGRRSGNGSPQGVHRCLVNYCSDVSSHGYKIGKCAVEVHETSGCQRATVQNSWCNESTGHHAK